MSKSRQRVLPVLLATAALVGAANLGAYAANGSPLLAGKSNSETKSTVVVNRGPGPALKLTSKANSPSLSVSAKVKVPRLNADRVDGLDGDVLQNRDTHFVVPNTIPAANMTTLTFRVRPGRYLMSYAMVLGGNPFACFTTQIPNTALSFAVPSGFGASSAASSTVVTVPSNGRLELSCNADGGSTFSFISADNDALSTVDFLRLDKVTTGAAPTSVPSRPGPGRAANSGR